MAVEPAWAEVSRAQSGVLTRRQALAGGLTAGQIRARLSSGRWLPVGHGVYATFTGPLPPMTRLWVALLQAGPDAVAGPVSSLWLIGLEQDPPKIMDVCIPVSRKVERSGIARPGVHRRCALDLARSAAGCPPRLRVEEAVLDRLGDVRRPGEVIDLVLRAVQQGFTTADRLAGGLDRRRAHRWRELVTELLAEVREGVRSPLERRWLRDVVRPHGLPAGRMNHREATDDRARYRDVEYRWGLVCELDGREAHPDHARHRDRHRDNRVAVSGRTTLRYGWREVVGDPCGVAAEVAEVLRRLGWTGTLHSCGPACRIS